MKKRTGFVLSFALVCVLVVCALPISASAICLHKERKEDECVNCGQLRVWKSQHKLPFIARYNGDDAPRSHEEGRGSSKTVNWYREGDRLYVVGRTRNKHGNLWLKLDDGSYIWSEYVAYDFDAEVDRAYNLVQQKTFLHDLADGADGADGDWYINMATLFRADGDYDLKMIDLLGNRYKEYYVYSSATVQDKKMSGEELGNILYGRLFARSGRAYEEALRYASWADFHWNPKTPEEKREQEKWAACWSGILRMCDDRDDRNSIYLGYWIENHRSSNSCVSWKYDVISPY